MKKETPNSPQTAETPGSYEERILDALPVGALLTRINNGTILYANQAIAHLLGIPDAVAILGQPVPNFYWDPEDRQVVLGRFRAEGKLENHPLRVRRADESMFWASITLRPFQFEGETVILTTISDISENKRAEEGLAREQAFMRALMDSIPDKIYFKDLQSRFLLVSKSQSDEFSLSDPSDAVGKSDFDFFTKEHAQEAYEDEQTIIRTGQSITKDTWMDRPDTWVWTTKLPLYDETGRLAGIFGISREITESKQAERSLRESEERFRAIYDNATVGLYRTTPDGRISTINPAGLHMLGFNTFEELAQRNLEQAGFEIDQARQEFREKLENEGVISGLESNWVRKDGSTIMVSESATLFRDENGQILYYDGSFEDITARKQAEKDLKESEIRFRTLFEQSTDAYLIIDGGLFVECNQATVDMLRANAKAEVLSTHPSELSPDFQPDGRPSGEKAEEMIQIAIERGRHRFEWMHRRMDGEDFPVEVLLTTIPIEGRTMIQTVWRDLTERKKFEAQVQEAFERRGYQVQVSTEISQEVASATEISDLFDRVVTLTKERLGYYHTQLFRYDPSQEAAVLISGYGEIGQKMLADGHKLPMGVGLIGTAAASGETLLRSNLAEDLDWYPNPLLPETQGEIAVPIKWQNTVLGVLDVQSSQPGALSDEDRLLLEGLCGQIAIAMHSAELVEVVRQNEAHLAEALRIARLADWEYDVEKDIFTFNDQFYSIFHTTAEKAGGYQISSARYAELFVHPDDMQVVGTEIGKALSSTERVYNATVDHRIIYEDGGIGYIMVQLTVERDENGKITRYYGANQDITERKLVEEALRINEARLAEALRIARLANWEYDVEKDIFTFNDQFYSIFHTTAEKAGGYQISSARYAELFVHPDDMQVVGTEIGKALSSTERVYNATVDHRIIYEDGGIGYIMVQLTVERDENGKITRYYGANQDITERKKQEEAIAERLEEINRLYQNLSHEGWKTYRNTADLPAGFIYDQTGVRAVDEEFLADESSISIPMKVLGGEVVGMLAIAEDSRNPISAEDRVFLQQVSEQVALALESARLSAQTQSALAQTEKLSDASLRFARAADLQELTAIAVTTINIPKVNRAFLVIFSYDEKGALDRLDLVANWWNGTGHEAAPIGTRLSREIFQIMPMFISQTPVFFDDVLDDHRVDAGSLELAKRSHLRAVAVLPLFSGSQQVGALILEAEEPHNFTQNETRMISALAPQIATVLENRRQFERAQKQAEREGMLNIISQKIQSATTVEAVLQIAARELGHALGAPMTIAQLSMKDKK